MSTMHNDHSGFLQKLAHLKIEHCTPKIAYLSIFCTNACVSPFLTLIFETRGLSKSEIGSVVALVPLARFLCAPLWTFIADKHQQHRLVASLTFAGAAFSLFLLYLSSSYFSMLFSTVAFAAFSSAVIPLIDARVLRLLGPGQRKKYGAQRLWGAFSWGANSAFIGVLADWFGGSLRVFFLSYWINGAIFLVAVILLFHPRLEQSDYDDSSRPFLSCFSRLGLTSFTSVNGVTTSATDSMTVEPVSTGADSPSDTLKEVNHHFSIVSSDDEDEISASPASSITSPSTIILSESTGLRKTSPQEPVQLHQIHNFQQISSEIDEAPSTAEHQLTEASNSSSLPVSSLATESSTFDEVSSTEASTSEPLKMSFIEALLLITADPYSTLFLLICFCLGFGTSIVFSYLFLFLHDDLGASNSLLGVSVAMTVLFEFPFFWFSELMLEKLHVRGMMILAHVAYVLRVFVYTLLKDPWLVLFVEPLHGVTFACSWNSIIEYAVQVSPPGLESTTQGVFSGVFNGFGHAIGAVIGGFLFQSYGAVTMFRTSAFVILCSCVLFITIRPHHVRRCASYVTCWADRMRDHGISIEDDEIKHAQSRS